MLRETDIALLEARPLGRIRMYLEIAQGKSEVVRELLRDPGLLLQSPGRRGSDS